MASDYEAISEYNERKLGEDRASRMSQVAMYADTAHFVYELLQNADDVGATEIHFTVSAEQLVVEHNGTPFTEHNVNAISYFGKGKTDITKIGHFGLGFKSVFAYTASPRVHSGDENFEITALYSVAEVSCPKDLEQGRTRFILPFDHYLKKPDYIEHSKLKSAEKAYNEIAEKLSNLGSKTLLFTKSLIGIHWKTEDCEGHYSREDNPAIDDGREVCIVTANKEECCYLVFDRAIQWPDDNGIKKERRPVQIAFGLDKRLMNGGAIQEVKDARLSVFFPTDKETHVGLIIQGQYRTTPARDNVPTDDDFNQHLVNQTATLLVGSLSTLKKLNLLNLATLSMLPVDHDKFKEGTFFRPLYFSVRKALATRPFLPAANHAFISGSHAKLARGAELTKVFQSAQLEQLFGIRDLQWLDPELTLNNYPTLHRLVVGKKAPQDVYFQRAEWIEPPLTQDIEVDSEDVAKRITVDFMAAQSDQWVIHFYEYLSKAGQWHYKSRPIIRLEGDIHVTPFGKNNLPNAFLSIGEDDEDMSELPSSAH